MSALTLTIAVVAGVASGVAYTMSPLTVVLALVVVWACRYALRDLGPRERRWVGAALAVAIAIRVLAITVLLLATDPAQEQFRAWFPDARFAIARSWWIRNLWFDVPIGPMNLFGIYETYGASSFSYVLAAVQAVFGLAPYGVNLINVAALVVGALVLFRLARRAYGANAAVPALVIVLFWPTMLAWSVSALREASQLCLVAVALACTVAAIRQTRWSRRLLAAGVAVAAVAAVGTLRAGALIIVALSIPLGLAIRLIALRTWVAAAVASCVLVVGAALATRADVRAFVEYQTDLAANRHLGQATTPGRSFKLLDERFYDEGPQSTFTVTRAEAIRFLARSAAAFVLVPAPWHAASRSELAIAPQQVLWYALVLLAIVGVGAAWRRDALVTALLASYGVVGLVVIAPNSGNTGTLVRHRDMIAPVVTYLSGAGLIMVAAWTARRRATEPSATIAPNRISSWLPFDERGRLFGRVNPVDAGAVATVLLAVALSVSTVRVFSVVPPVIDRVDPSVLENGNRRLRLAGHDFRGYLRAFVGPAGGLLVLPNPVNQKSEATWLMRTTSDVELVVPTELEPGAYDLYLYDAGREIVKRSSAFTLRGDGTSVPARHAGTPE